MKQNYLIEKTDFSRLLLFFTGWSTDWKILSNIEIPDGYDFLCVWDYSEIADIHLSPKYKEVVVIAWSFGIPVASAVVENGTFKSLVTGMFAINGSCFPVDDSKGIPKEIFNSTLENIDERNLGKFRLRMCGSRNTLALNEVIIQSESPLSLLKKELAVFSPEVNDWNSDKAKNLWDFVFIAEYDKIFPLRNLMGAWEGIPQEIMKNGEHFPDFQRIFNRIIKNKSGIGRNFSKVSGTYDEQAHIQQTLIQIIAERLQAAGTDFNNILEIGSGSGLLSRKIRELFPDANLTLIDLCNVSPLEKVEYLCVDAEQKISGFESGSFDLICSSATIQWFHSPKRFFRRGRNVLSGGGYMVFSAFVEGTYKEIKDLTGQSLLYYTPDDYSEMVLAAGFEIIESQKLEVRIEFDTPLDVINHIKHTGVNSLNAKKEDFAAARSILNNYPANENGKFELTYNSIVMILRKRDE